VQRVEKILSTEYKYTPVGSSTNNCMNEELCKYAYGLLNENAQNAEASTVHNAATHVLHNITEHNLLAIGALQTGVYISVRKQYLFPPPFLK
jgi:hypothetical protein